jgi:MFS transporter, DHA1 family, multidrug resistance protein
VRLSWRAANLLFFCCLAIQFSAEGHVTAFTPLLLERELGLTPPEVAAWSGLLFAITSAMALPLGPFWGVLAERFSRRNVVLRSFFVMAAALLVVAWAPDIPWMIVGRMLVGLSFGSLAVILAAQTLLVPRQRLGAAMATVQAAIPVAASLGPPLGALLIPHLGIRGLFVLDAACNLLAGLALLVLMPEPASPIRKVSFMARMREVLGLAWTMEPVRWNFFAGFLFRGAGGVVESYLPVRIAQLADDPPVAIGWILGIYGGLTTVLTWLSGRVVDRVDETKLFWRLMLLSSVITLGIAVAPWLWLLGLFAVLRAVPSGFFNVTLMSHLAGVLPAEHRTPLFSLSPVPRNFGATVFPLLAALATSFVPAGAFLVATAATIGTTLVGLKMDRLAERDRRGSIE